VAVKHATPCGVGIGATLAEAWKKAFDADPVSIFGGIVAFNCTVDADTAAELVKIFLEIVIAPRFSPEALEIFKTKPNLRVLQIDDLNKPIAVSGVRDMKRVYGGLLIQDKDDSLYNEEEVRVVTKRAPTKGELAQLKFAYMVVKHVKSNAIVLAGRSAAYFSTVGVGGGQTNRIDAAKQAIARAGSRARGAVMASDAYFPFPDCVEEAAAAGIAAIIQPGGSIRDQESVDACDKYGIAMVTVGQRHFKH